MWFYVSGPTGPSGFQSDTPRQRDLLGDPDFAARVERAERDRRHFSADDPTTASSSERVARDPRLLKQQWAEQRRRLVRFLEDLDDTGARFRSRLRRSPITQVTAGWSDLNADRPQAALRHFDRILQRQPNHADALFGKAAALATMRRYREAADTYDRLLTFEPDDVEGRYNYGAMLSRLGEFGAASEQFREVIRLESDHVKAHYNLAGLAQRNGRLTEARDHWQIFTQLRPDVTDGWFNLGIIHLDLEQPREAVSCFSYLTLVHPEDAFAHANLALAYMQTHDLDAALATLKTANELSPCDPAILRSLADLHRTIAEWNPADKLEHLEAASLIDEQLGMLEAESSTALVAEKHEKWIGD